MTTNANILLSIGSKLGPGGFASLQSAIQMISGFASSVSATVEKLDNFKMVMDQVDMSMVNMADSAAAGQIDTQRLMSSLSQIDLIAPHLKITGEQFSALAARAAEFGIATGQSADILFDRMMMGLLRAEAEGLKPFGIKLEQTTDFAKAQKEALDKLTDGYIGFKNEVETNTQRLTALSNNWDTFVGALWSATGSIPGVSSVIDSLNETLSETVVALTETSQAVRDYVFQLENLPRVFKMIQQGLLGLFGGAVGPSEFQKWIEEGLADPALAAAVKAEAEAKAAAAATPARKGKGKGSAGFKTSEEMVFTSAEGFDEYTYQLLMAGGASEDEAYRAASAAKGAQGFRIGREGDYLGAGSRYAGSEDSVDLLMEEVAAEEEKMRIFTDQYAIQQRISEIKEAEMYSMREQEIEREAMLELMEDEEYHESRLAEMRESALLATKERMLQTEFELEQQIDFAHEFKAAWRDSFTGVSAGAMAASGAVGILRKSWGAVITSAIEGANSIGEGVRRAVQMVATEIAIEAGLRALVATGYAIYSAAKRDYTAAAAYGVAAAEFFAVAAIAGTAAATASAFGHSTSRVSKVSASSSRSGSGGYGSSYMGSYNAQESQTVTYVLQLDDSAQMFKLVKDENVKASRDGSQSFILAG